MSATTHKSEPAEEALRHDNNELQVRLRQQAALARFGRRAVASSDLDQLLTEATMAAAQGLGASYAKVLELLPAGESLLVRAGYGWSEGVVGIATIGLDSDSPAGYALQTGQPVQASNLASETRFRVPKVLQDHGVVSAVNVIIRGEGAPFGVLEVDSRQASKYTEEDVHFLEGFANLLATAIERQRMTALLQVALREKETLLRELQHRIKNNLQMITSFISLQARQTTDPVAQSALDVVKGRVQTLALVHQKLDSVGSVGDVDLGSYLDELITNLTSFSGADTSGIEVRRNLTSIWASIDIAVPLGLIVNEFMANSLKYAFPDGRGCVSVTLRRLDPRFISLTLADNGIGRSAAPGRTDGVGLKLIESLITKVDGQGEWQEEGGTRLILHVPLQERHPAPARSATVLL